MKTVVVARWQENIDWIQGLPDGWAYLVAQKERDIPNEGREAGSFFWIMHALYDQIEPDHVLAFVQGNPFDHAPTLFEQLAEPFDTYAPLGNYHPTCDLTGAPHHAGLPIAQAWEEYLIGGPPPDELTFTAGGQFMVTGEAILRRPADYYDRMVQAMTRGEAPWVMERLWGYLFRNEHVSPPLPTGASVSVITAALPSRVDMLAEAVRSVTEQTHMPVEHLIEVDYAREGSAAVRNRLVEAATGEYVAFLDDDDRFLPRHLELLTAENADVAYSPCLLDIRYAGMEQTGNPVEPFDPVKLRTHNYIAVTCLVRRSLFLEVGGFRHSSECKYGWEDHDLWLRLLDAGAEFKFVPEISWSYTLHHRSKTYVGERDAL